MNLRLLLAAGLLGLLAACSQEPSDPPPEPVKSTPLAGTVDGQPWVAVSGTASAHKAFAEDGGEKWIDIGAGTFTCNDFLPHAELIGTIPWEVTAYDLSLKHNLTLINHYPDGGIVNEVMIRGRVEILSAPDAGTATLRIRAVAGAENSIEGQVDVAVCD